MYVARNINTMATPDGKLLHPVLFPCADRVKVPQVGADESKFKGLPILLSEIILPFGRPTQVREKLQRNYLKRVSADLTFSKDVVRVHAAHTLPYNKDDIHQAFEWSDIIQRNHKRGATGPTGRHNARGTDNKHLPCHIKTISRHRLKPLHRNKSKPKPIENSKTEVDKDGIDSSVTSTSNKTDSQLFQTEDALAEIDTGFSSAHYLKQEEETSSPNWDEHLLKYLSKNTARWIISEKMTEGPHKDKLQRVVTEMHGEATHPVDTLIRDDASDITDADVQQLGKAQWSKMRITLSASRRFKPTTKKKKKKRKGEVADDDASWDDEEEDEHDLEKRPLASFYKLPGGIRKQQKQMEKRLAGAVNSTAKNIKIVHKKPKPPPTLRDVMNPAVGSMIYDTSNQYEQEWLSGATQVHKQDSSQLVLDTGNKYQVLRQENFPQNPATWFADSDKNINNLVDESSLKKRSDKRVKVPHKGYKKWSRRPEPVQDNSSVQIRMAGHNDELYQELDPAVRRQHMENPALVTLVDEWRTKWHLGNKWYESSIEDLVRDMADINEHVRLQTIATIARAATYRPPAAPGIPIKNALGKIMGKEDDVKQQAAEGHLPPKLLECVQKALADSCHRVRVTGAIALYTLCRPNEEARQILRSVIRTGSAPERWAAAQCLAHSGVCDSYVVGELVQQVFNCENAVKFEQCMTLMSRLSGSNTIVHSMVAEQLNSTSWRHRIIACRILPRLSGTVNKDITHKLANIMWNDWHKDVRMVAAQTLGKTGHGKEVHDDLRERLITGSERDRIDALHKIGLLGIMTARLLPAYLQCFDDVYISVRVAAITTASKLLLEEDKVTTKLLFITQYDNNWKVKAHALKALGDIGKLNENIQAAVVWAVRFESEPGVRAEACRTLVRVGIRGGDVSAVLQDKLLVEPDNMVREQLAVALESMGVSPTGDMEMVQQIKDEVRRLCTRGNIAAKIAHHEDRENTDEHHERFFNAPMSLPPDNKKIQSVNRLSTMHFARSTTPNIHVTSEEIDRIDLPDFTLPKTPSSEVSDTNRQFLSPAFRRRDSAGSPSRRTPVEKLDKLIALYDEACSIKEYNTYVKSEDEEEETEDGEESEALNNAKISDKLSVENTNHKNQDNVNMVAKDVVKKDDGEDIMEKAVGDHNLNERVLPSTKTTDFISPLVEADTEFSVSDQRSELMSSASTTMSGK